MRLKIHSSNHSNTITWYSFSNNSNIKEEIWIIRSRKIGIRGPLNREAVSKDKESPIKIIKLKDTSPAPKTFLREWWLQRWTATINRRVSKELNRDNRVDRITNRLVGQKTKPASCSRITNKSLGKKNKMEFKIVTLVKIPI